MTIHVLLSLSLLSCWKTGDPRHSLSSRREKLVFRGRRGCCLLIRFLGIQPAMSTGSFITAVLEMRQNKGESVLSCLILS